MKIIKASEEMKASMRYRMTRDQHILKMSDVAGTKLTVAKWLQYEDESTEKDGTTKLQTLLSVMDDDGTVYATVSATFQREFFAMVDMFAEDGETIRGVEVVSGTSKNGRPYITAAFYDPAEDTI